MKGQSNNVITTKYGTFVVRYATKKEDGNTYLIIGKNVDTDEYTDVFSGEFGDEILYTKSGMKHYDAVLPKTFKI